MTVVVYSLKESNNDCFWYWGVFCAGRGWPQALQVCCDNPLPASGREVPMIGLFVPLSWRPRCGGWARSKRGSSGLIKIEHPDVWDVYHGLTELSSLAGVDMSVTSITSSFIELSAISALGFCASVMGAGDIGVTTLRGLRGKKQSFKLRGWLVLLSHSHKVSSAHLTLIPLSQYAAPEKRPRTLRRIPVPKLPIVEWSSELPVWCFGLDKILLTTAQRRKRWSVWIWIQRNTSNQFDKNRV